MKKELRILVILIAVLLVGTVGYYSCQRNSVRM